MTTNRDGTAVARTCRVGDQLEVRVSSVGAGGVGVAHDPAGKVVFIPRTAPADRVMIRITESRPRYAAGRIVRRLEDGPARVEPTCPVYDRGCGGCGLQHLETASQRAIARQVVEDALRRIGGVPMHVPPLRSAGPRLGYRNRVTFRLRRDGDQVTAGYHDLASAERVLNVADCPLAEPPNRRAWTQLRNGWTAGAAALPSGTDLRLTLRCSAAGEIALLVKGGIPGCHGDPPAVARAIDGLVCYHATDGRGDRYRLLGGSALPESWSGIDLELLPEAFLQSNRWVSAAMDDYLDARLGNIDGLRILDLYAGVGVRSIRWSQRGAEVVACEWNRDAIRTGRRAARRLGVSVRFLEGPVGRRLPELSTADLLVVNPPRRGLGKDVIQALSARDAAALVYVSCDPATLARDVHRLSESWRLTDVQPFDAFPHTSHVETIAWLEAISA